MAAFFAPFIRASDKSRHHYSDIIIALSALLVMSYFNYGPRVFILAGISFASCLVFSLLEWFSAREGFRFDASFAVTSFMIVLLLPATSPYYLPVIGTAFAILIAKIPFGGTGNNVFNPAAAGFCFLCAILPGTVFDYPAINSFGRLSGSLPISDTFDFIRGISPAAALKLGTAPSDAAADILIGNFTGPIGCVFIVVILAGYLLLASRRHGLLLITLPAILTAAGVAFLFPRFSGDPFSSILYELAGGSFLFCACFMACDPSTSPHSKIGKTLFGVLFALITMVMRRYGPFEEGAPFAILIVNTLSLSLDKISRRYHVFMRTLFGDSKGGARV